MRATVWHGGEKLTLEERPVPTPAANEVLIKVAACGICGTDVHIIEDKFPLYPPPRVIGHEYTGTVAAVGARVRKVRPGDRVVVEPGYTCGDCYFCRQGRENLCEQRIVHPGGFAEYTCVPERLVHLLPAGVSFEMGSLAEPLACALRAWDLAAAASGAHVGILGGGAVGLLLTQLALHSGAVKVVLSEPREHRRAVAKMLGAVAVDGTREDLPAILQAETGGLGPEIIFDAVGNPTLLTQALELVQRGGTVVEVGVADPAAVASFRPYLLFEKELTIRGSHMRPYTFHRAVRWLTRLTLAPLLGLEFRLEETLEAIRSQRAGKGIKLVVKP
ncbi:MAG TPA: alcohol dehydrogenase catalytic domain-containing protein [Candidatus Methylomirabilis sp.]|jgi:2-desacetyl-2-hydroxyethyl bacteriochlorophyllide A dehydrogenase|nr:alcohol dehydrogenase catalytic domain-containing protein [Candidatus Methylomirabilis sp.]